MQAEGRVRATCSAGQVDGRATIGLKSAPSPRRTVSAALLDQAAGLARALEARDLEQRGPLQRWQSAFERAQVRGLRAAVPSCADG